jgi:hypothetical protein
MEIKFSLLDGPHGIYVQAMGIQGQPIAGTGKGIEEAVKNLITNVTKYKEKYNTKIGETPKRYLVADRED